MNCAQWLRILSGAWSPRDNPVDDFDPAPIDLEDIYTKIDRIELDLTEQVRQTRWLAIAACAGILMILLKLYS